MPADERSAWLYLPPSLDGAFAPSRRHTALQAGLAFALLFLVGADSRRAVAAQVLHLPYPAGVSVQIIQGYNGGTHNGVERYSIDLVRGDGATAGSPVPAPASGTVAFAQIPGGEHGCIGVAMDDSGDFHYMLCHILLNRTYFYGDRIHVGDSLGTVAPPGQVGNNGTAHIHMQLYTLPGQQRTPVPFAPPQGMSLEGVTLAVDGSYNEWACAGASCHNMVSSAPSNGTTLLAGSSTVLSASTSAPSAGSVTSAAQNRDILSVGQPAVVQGTGDCLRSRAQPTVGSTSTGCAPDGTLVFVGDGPAQADGHTWWFLRTLGWSVADYLRPATGSSALRQVSTPQSSASISQTTAASTNSSLPSVVPATPSLSLKLGATARVFSPGDCLRVHDSPSLDALTVGCLADGRVLTLDDGPRTADGHDWWHVDAGGWAAADYLQVISSV